MIAQRWPANREEVDGQFLSRPWQGKKNSSELLAGRSWVNGDGLSALCTPGMGMN
ncbi:hypothetical protein [Halochromatium glycolicum]|uniref:hypothetical protein n=1 Tax=Halochromatium glycolicum TaxID=85075 RepID=UPI001909B0BF|nr:hypothetical protein [Halochromatium glycolicum]